MGNRYNHLSVEERNDIQTGLNLRLSRRALARRLHRPPSTISREIHRSSGPSYDAARAGQQARGRRRRGPRKLASGSVLEHAVQAELQRGWSPEQIAGRLKQMHPQEPSERVSHETIYAYIYAQPRGELRKLLIGALRHAHKTRLPRSRGQDRRGRLRDMVSIHDRPLEVQGRQIAGHWEGDLIKGAGNASAVGTLVERKSRFVLLAKVDHPDAESVLEGFTRRLRTLPASLRKTLTYDQGREMARHLELAKRLHLRVYFADPHSPWQRPTNENTNGLLREYLPKGMDFSGLSQRYLTQVATALNTRPRKCLGFLTPEEVMSAEINHLTPMKACRHPGT
jgi:IS30 family transposase